LNFLFRWLSWLGTPLRRASTRSAGSSPSAVAAGSADALVPSSRRNWLVLGLALAVAVALALLAINREAHRLGGTGSLAAQTGDIRALQQAWSVANDGAHFPESMAASSGKAVSLPDAWSRSQPGYKGSVWYRFQLTQADVQKADAVLGALISRACSSVEVQLNGAVVFRNGRMVEPYAPDCSASHVVVLPTALLRPQGNVLDIKVAGYPLQRVAARQRAGGLSGVSVGPLGVIRHMAEEQTFWSVTLSQIMGGVLIFMGVFSLGLAWVRRLKYLLYFGLLTMGWALLTGHFCLADLAVPNDALEVFFAITMAPMTAFAIKFLLGYVGTRSTSQHAWNRRINLVLWGQCLLLPVSLMLLGVDQLFLSAGVWFLLFAVELFLAIGHFLWVTGQSRRAEFWLMSVALGVLATVLGIELFYQSGLLENSGIYVTHLVMPLLYAAVGARLIQVYARALLSAEGARAHLERRVQEISVEIERNFNQIAELRVDQITEKERKRIAGDLHDDLGAKLLTIVHTSDNDRISTLAREALEEMRLSVRGLTGRPMVLSDSLADWRSEVVSRLGQAGIECEWRNPNDVIEEPLSSRTYVQTTRIVREAVSNIIKHSRASHVGITADVDLEHHVFCLVIQDNGRGIPMELDGRLDRGHGMTSMKHRAKQLNGQCLVESGPGFGTVIRLTLPLEIAALQQVLPLRPRS
jgi:two-component system sensor histidine kinase UhpB